MDGTGARWPRRSVPGHLDEVVGRAVDGFRFRVFAGRVEEVLQSALASVVHSKPHICAHAPRNPSFFDPLEQREYLKKGRRSGSIGPVGGSVRTQSRPIVHTGVRKTCAILGERLRQRVTPCSRTETGFSGPFALYELHRHDCAVSRVGVTVLIRMPDYDCPSQVEAFESSVKPLGTLTDWTAIDLGRRG